jgi:hypothetical protein
MRAMQEQGLIANGEPYARSTSFGYLCSASDEERFYIAPFDRTAYRIGKDRLKGLTMSGIHANLPMREPIDNRLRCEGRTSCAANF